MKLLTSAAFGAAALATALIGSAQPAAARTSFGVYVGGPAYYGGYDYRYRCDDYWYRRAHPYRCRAAYDYDDYDDDYYPSAYYNDYYYGPGIGFTFYGDRHHRRGDWGHHRGDWGHHRR